MRSLRYKSLLFSLFLFVSLGGYAARGATHQDPLYVTHLQNGMQVVLYQNHRNPVVSLNMFVKVGSMYENERINGISHFFEHLFFRGTMKRTGEQFKRDIESLGGQTNANTTKDLTHFYINLPSQYYRQGLDILADALMNARLQGTEVELERKAVLDEYRIGLESPGAILQELIYQEAFKTHPYRLSIIGTEKSIKGISLNDLIDFRHRYYVPSRTTLVIVGDITPSELMPAVKQYFGEFRGRDGGQSSVVQEDSLPAVHERTERRNLRDAYVVFGFRSPSVRDRPDIYRTDVLTFLLGQGEGALLNKRLVDEKKLATAVSADFLTQRDAGLIEIEATCQPNRIEKVRETMVALINEVRDGKFTQADFARAKVLLRNTYKFGNESDSGMADGLGFYASIDNVNFALNYLDEVDKVTFEDVVATARKYLDLHNYNVLVVRPPDRRAVAP